MENRITPLQDDALVVVQSPGVRVPRTLKMKACLYIYWRKFSKEYYEKINTQ